MKIYNVIIKDRHCDTTAEPFAGKYDAIFYARMSARKNCTHEEDYEESKTSDWVFYAEYSCEGDCVYVTEHDLK